MKRKYTAAGAAMLTAGAMLAGAVPVPAQDVTIVGQPIVLQVSQTAGEAAEQAVPENQGTENGQETAAGSGEDAAGVTEKEVDSFRLFGGAGDGMLLIRTDGSDEYVSREELAALLPELNLEGFPVMEETPAIGQGTNGEEAAALQQVLADLGYLDGEVDGSYGGGTAAAVAAFQTDRGLEATGTADVYTMMLIRGIQNGLEESVEVSSKRYDTPEEKFPEIADNTAADLEQFMEPSWRYAFDELTQSGTIDRAVTLGSFAVESPAIDQISGKVSAKVRVTWDEETAMYVLTPVLVVETESAFRPYIQGAILNGDDRIKLAEVETTGGLSGITMNETGYITFTPEALETLASGDVKSIILLGKSKDYEVELAVQGDLAAWAEACRAL